MKDVQTQIYEFGEFRVDAGKRLFYGRGGEPVALTPKVFDTLLYLVQNSGKVIEKDELMTAIWSDSIVEENNLNKNISILRRALGEKKNEHRFIVTVPGRGYKFVADVVSPEAAEDGKGKKEDAEKNLSGDLEFQISNFKLQNEPKSGSEIFETTDHESRNETEF